MLLFKHQRGARSHGNAGEDVGDQERRLSTMAESNDNGFKRRLQGEKLATRFTAETSSRLRKVAEVEHCTLSSAAEEMAKNGLDDWEAKHGRSAPSSRSSTPTK